MNKLLLAFTFMLFAGTATAATFTTEGDNHRGYKTHTVSITNLDTGTDQISINGCSAVQIVADPSAAATATIVAQMDAAGAVSHTVVISSGNLGVSGTTIDIPAGALKIQADVGTSVSPVTVNLAVVERVYQNCRLLNAR